MNQKNREKSIPCVTLTGDQTHISTTDLLNLENLADVEFYPGSPQITFFMRGKGSQRLKVCLDRAVGERVLFNYLKEVKARANPLDRILPFEGRGSHGFPDPDLEERILWGRMNKAEKSLCIDAEKRLEQAFKNRGMIPPESNPKSWIRTIFMKREA